MFDVLNKPEAELLLDAAGKREAIERELRKDPSRSNREIARVIGNGICHKTVGGARERLAPPLPITSPTLAPSRPKPEVKPKPEEEEDVMDKKSFRVIAEQPETAMYWNPHGNIVIRQRRWDTGGEDDPFIYFAPEHAPAIIAKLQAMLRGAEG